MNIQNIPTFQDLHNIEAEQALLGAILINNDALRLVDGFLQQEHFFEPIHGEIYQLCRDMTGSGRVATPVTLRGFLPAERKIGGSTVGQYLAHLMAEATTIINAGDYARVVLDFADRRRIKSIGIYLADANEVDVLKLAGNGIDELDEIASRRGSIGSPALTMGAAAARAVDAIALAYQLDGRIAGISWGLRDLDRKTLGMQRQELVVVAGRPGMGKTA